MDLDLFGLSLLDCVLVMGLLGAGAFYILRNKKNEDEFDANSIKSFNMIPTQDRNVTNTTFVTKMKTHNRNVIVFYGSQTGTAEEFAARLAKECSRFGLKAMVADPEECDMEELVNLKDIPNSLAIFCMATYGEGDPTDNAQEFFEWLGNTDVDLSQINYAVFGLGNKTYEHYNQVAIAVDKKLEKLGANRVIDIGLGDDDGNIEEDFITWKELLWTGVCEKFNLLISGEDICLRQYELKVYKPEELSMDQVYKGEIVRLNSYMNQKTPYHAKNPFMAPITVNRELYKGNRSCMHIELNIEDSKIRYEAGDHVGVYPRNDENLVNRIGQLLEVDLDTIITLNNVDEDSSKKHPFPCPCSYRSALLYYVDISHTPRTHILKELAEHARDEEEKRLLKTMSSPTEEGKHLYSDYIIKNQRSIVHVLEDMKSVKIPLDQLLEMIPRLQSRYYSISSSPRLHPKSIHLTAVYIEYETPTNRRVEGVATSWMKKKQVISGVNMTEEEVTKHQDPHNHDSYFALIQDQKCPKVPIFVRKSQFKLPSRLSVPIIMIGPGTGLAPFRGFLQERASLKQKYSDKEMGANILYYGCRHRDQDYLYEQELQSYLDQQVLTKLHVAFSRDQAEKVYVTHLLKQNKQEIWDIIGPSKNGHIYVCGDARTMAKDVREIILEVIQEFGHKSEKEAEQFLKQMEIQRRYSADVWS